MLGKTRRIVATENKKIKTLYGMAGKKRIIKIVHRVKNPFKTRAIGKKTRSFSQ